MSQETLASQLEDLRLGKLPSRQAYHVIHEIGKAYFIQARPVVEGFLRNEDPELRYISREVLACHWRLKEHWQTARDFLERDPDVFCRMMGASAMEVLTRDSKDRPTLAALAAVVLNEGEDESVREAAYIAMRGVARYDPKEHFQLSCKGVDWTGVDWAWVKGYL
jgi:hypothetical protein